MAKKHKKITELTFTDFFYSLSDKQRKMLLQVAKNEQEKCTQALKTIYEYSLSGEKEFKTKKK